MQKDRFYKANEDITLRFYQMPKALFNNPRYKGLSLGAKAMYSILRDRQELSISSNLKNDEQWVDEEGNIYLLFPIEPRKGDERSVDEKEPRELSLTEILEIDRKTVMKYKKELVEYELIIDKRQGQGKVSRTYVLKPELPSDNVEKCMKSKKRTSKSPKKGLPEVQKFPGIDTDISETDISETINQSIESENKKESINKKGIDRLTDIDNKFKNIGYKTYKELLNELQLKVTLSEYPYANWLGTVEKAIWEMYYYDETKIKNRMVDQYEVVSKLQDLNWNMIINAIDKVNEISQYEKIKYPVAFMKTTIFNEIDEFSARVQVQANYDLSDNEGQANFGSNYKNRFHNLENRTDDYTERELEKIAKNKREGYYNKSQNNTGNFLIRNDDKGKENDNNKIENSLIEKYKDTEFEPLLIDIKKELTPVSYETYFDKNITEIRKKDNNLVIKIKGSKFIKGVLETHYLSLIKKHFNKIGVENIKIIN